jgi:[CysO sulfur-carrier protein]-thiocarboxylate-dependent cysteine synthase
MRYQNIVDMIARTPSVRVNHITSVRAPLFVKLEGWNPTGSIKDRACAFMLQSAVQSGALTPDKSVLDGSSGNFACALAFYGKIMGYAATVAVSSKLTAAKRDFLTYLGASIHYVGDFTIQANEFCRKLADKSPGKYCFLDQLHNWDNPKAHYQATAPEILAEFPDVEMIVGSLGSGGTMSGVAEYMKQTAPHVKIVAVECASGSRIPGTGTFVDGDYVSPFIQKAREQGHFDLTVKVSEQDAASATRTLINQGIFCGVQTGGVLHAALTGASLADIRGPIVVLSGDSGWKNLDKLMPLAASWSQDPVDCLTLP